MDLSQKTDNSDTPEGDRPYSFRPSPMGGGYTFQLSDTGLVFQAGRRNGTVPYGNIRRLRMSYKPANMQMGRFMTEIWPDGQPKLTVVSSSWTGLMVQERQDKAYLAFVTALHRRLVASDAPVSYERGTPPFIYWPGLVMYGVVSLGIALLAVRGLQSGTYAGAAFVAAFLGLFLWQGGNFFRRNRPGVYQADALPEELMPRI